MRLNLPIQGAIDRRQPYEPYLVVVAEIRRKDEYGNVTITLIKTEPGGNYGPDPSDPSAIRCRDSRGWHCQPISGYAWEGVL